MYKVGHHNLCFSERFQSRKIVTRHYPDSYLTITFASVSDGDITIFWEYLISVEQHSSKLFSTPQKSGLQG